MSQPHATPRSAYFNEAIATAERILADVALEAEDADSLDGKLNVIAEALLHPLTSRYTGPQQVDAADVTDQLFTAMENNDVPTEHQQSLALFMHKFASYRASDSLQERALKLMVRAIDAAPDHSAARDVAEHAFAAAFRDVTDHYDYPHLRPMGLDATVARFAAHMPAKMRTLHKASMLRSIGYGSALSAYELESFEPFADALAAVARTQPWRGEAPALLDPMVEQVAYQLAHTTRRKVGRHAVNQNADDIAVLSALFRGIGPRVEAGYDIAGGASYDKRRAFAPKAMVYGMLLDDDLHRSSWYHTQDAPSLALINKHDVDPVTRNHAWHARSNFGGLLPRRQPRNMKVDNKLLADDIYAHLMYSEPLPPRIVGHFKGRRSRFVAPLPPQ